MSRGQAIVDTAASKTTESVWDAFRRWGYLQANLDPLGDLEPVPMPELDVHGPEADAARRFYCGTIGVEFMHIPDRERRQWIQDRMEADAAPTNQKRILEWLIRGGNFRAGFADALSGNEALFAGRRSGAAAAARCDFDAACEHGAKQAVVAMSHRGRLNVMVHIVGRGAAEVFRAIRGCGSAQRAGRRRREISHGRDGRFRRG